MRKINMKKKSYMMKMLLAVVLVVGVGCCLMWNDRSVSNAAFHEGEPDSDNYEVYQIDSSVSGGRVSDPYFTVEKQEIVSGTTDVAYTEDGGTVIKGIGHFDKGDKFDIIATGGDGRPNFKGGNMTYMSSDENVAKVTKADANGRTTVTIVGPGVVTIQWSYQYQRFYDEETTEMVPVEDSTEPTGEQTTRVVNVKKRYVDIDTKTGTLTGEINPKITSTVNIMQPNDTLYLKTNVPSSNATFSADRNIYATGLTVTAPRWVAINNLWYIEISASGADSANGKIGVIASLNQGTLKSDEYEVRVVNGFKITPVNLQYNCTDFEIAKGASQVGAPKPVTKEIKVVPTADTDILWTYIDPEGTATKITSGTTEQQIRDGLFITLADGTKTAKVKTTAEFFDHIDQGESSYTFTLRASQSLSNSPDSTTYTVESVITITRPVKGIVIEESGSDAVINNDQVMYMDIGYDTHDDGRPIPTEKFTADAKTLIARLSGWGDDPVSNHPGTDPSQPDPAYYSFDHTPFNSKVTWTIDPIDPKDKDNMAIEKIGQDTMGNGESTCNIRAVRAGKASVTATTDDGKLLYSILFIVRPYPRHVIMEQSEIFTNSSGEPKNLQINAKVTSGVDEYDAYLDTKLKWTVKKDDGSEPDPALTIDDTGKLTYSLPGTITVTAVSDLNPPGHTDFPSYAPKAVCTVNVIQPVTGIKIVNTPETDLLPGTEWPLSVKVTPENASDKSVTWISADEKVAKVDENGKVTTVGPGKTTITVISNSSSKTDTCDIIVRRNADSVVLNRTEAIVSRGNKLNLMATVLPEDTTDNTITWTSSCPSVASVTDKGVVEGKRVSSTPVVITATTTNGKYAVCYVTVTEPVTNLKISPHTKTIYVGDTFEIKKTLYPLNNSSINSNVFWSSSDEEVATVDEDGVVIPQAGGKCVITAVAEDGGYTDQCTVIVKERVTQIKINDTKLTIQVGTSYKLRATVLRDTATNKAVKWSTSNKKVVTVSKNGKIKGVKVGKATVTVKAKDGSGVKAKCKVTVVRRGKMLTLNKSYITLIAGYQYKMLKAKVKPKNTTKKKLIWTTSNPAIVSINRKTGTMFAESAGTAFVTVKTTDGSHLSRTCRVKVIDPIPLESLTISQLNITLKKGQKSQLEVRTVPTNATSAVRWMTDDRSVATVSSNGLVTAKGPGNTVITAYSTEGLESQCNVTVVEMNPTSIAIEQYDTYTLAVDGAGDGTITWNSSNANIVKVANGTITGVSPGSATVSATYNGKKVNCVVTVKRIP